MERIENYSVTVYVAAPGTPLKDGGTSAAGHLYYVLARADERSSFGFSPQNGGAITAAGKISLLDEDDYVSPHYQRTMEISQEQYEKLRSYGEDPQAHGFTMLYHGATNSCIDFVWSALNHAGLHRIDERSMLDRDFQGALKPLDNIEHIRSIPAPLPESPLNTEATNEMPKRTLLQKLISDAQLPDQDRGMLHTIRTQVAGIDQRFNRTFDETSERISLGLLALAKEKGLERVDHVLLGNQTTCVEPRHAWLRGAGYPGGCGGTTRPKTQKKTGLSPFFLE